MPTRSEKIDRTKPASIIAQRFGGTSQLARAFDPPKNPSSVHRWLEGGTIPVRYQRELLDAAKARKVKLSEKDFVPAADSAPV